MHLTFVETAAFSRRWDERFDDEALRALQNVLLLDPRAGAPIPGCAVLRKLRFGDPGRGKGKRGGVRIIYLHTPEAARVDLIVVYGKDKADDLSPSELAAACAVARQIRAELVRKAAAGRKAAKGSK